MLDKMDVAYARLKHLATLGDNWGEYGSVSITHSAIIRCISVVASLLLYLERHSIDNIDAPFIAPLFDGGIAIETLGYHKIEYLVLIPPLLSKFVSYTIWDNTKNNEEEYIGVLDEDNINCGDLWKKVYL